VPGLLPAVDGLPVATPDGPVTLATAFATDVDAGGAAVDVRFANMGPIRRTLHAVATPSFAYVLIVMGLAALAFELTQPGFGFAGFAGALLLALAAYSLTIVPFSVVGLGLLVGGVGLLIWEVWRRRLGVVSAVGLLGFGAGSVLAFGGVADALAISPWLIGGAVVASILYYGFALTVALQSHDRIVATQRGLIGLLGEARGRLAPDGPVYVKGAVWRGRTAGEVVETGTPVRVRGVDGLVLRVEPEPVTPAGEPIPDEGA
jgi:membrane-bound serine protease (ClpP class)